ncbi:MAG: hypothetical protein ACTSV2_04840 [Candidatus Thorarchaeota archaeon]
MALAYIYNIQLLDVNKMVLDTPTKNVDDLKQSIISLITEGKLTSLQLISNTLAIDIELVVSLVKDLTSEGILNGTLSDDETRFYNSYVKVSSAPTKTSESHEIVIFEGNSIPGVIGVLAGIIMLISGSILRGMVVVGSRINFDAMGTSAAMIGLLVLIAGMLYIGKQNPIKSF